MAIGITGIITGLTVLVLIFIASRREKKQGPWHINIWQLPEGDWHWEIHYNDSWRDISLKLKHRHFNLWSGWGSTEEEANTKAVASLEKIKKLEQDYRDAEALKKSTTKTLKTT